MTRWGKGEGTTSAPRHASVCFFLFFLPPIIPLAFHFCGILCLLFSSMGVLPFLFFFYFYILSQCPIMHFSFLIGCLKLKKQSLLLAFTLYPAFAFEERKKVWMFKVAGTFLHFVLLLRYADIVYGERKEENLAKGLRSCHRE